jgi:hypothetical protein
VLAPSCTHTETCFNAFKKVSTPITVRNKTELHFSVKRLLEHAVVPLLILNRSFGSVSEFVFILTLENTYGTPALLLLLYYSVN